MGWQLNDTSGHLINYSFTHLGYDEGRDDENKREGGRIGKLGRESVRMRKRRKNGGV